MIRFPTRDDDPRSERTTYNFVLLILYSTMLLELIDDPASQNSDQVSVITAETAAVCCYNALYIIHQPTDLVVVQNKISEKTANQVSRNGRKLKRTL